jgi:hypothetical protein
MDARKAIRLDHQLDVVGHSIPDVKTAVAGRLIRDFEQAVDFVLVDVGTPGNLG